MSTEPKTKSKTKRFTIIIPEEWDEKIRRKAAEIKVSRSAIVKLALRKVLDDE